MIRKSICLILILLTLIFGVTSPIAYADDDDDEKHGRRWYNIFRDDDDHDDDHHDRHEGRKREYKGVSRRYIPPVSDPLYLKECGACHFAFQPQLLPAASWKKMMNQLENHFEEDAALTSAETLKLLQYMTSNSADDSPAKRSRKIMASLRGQAPLRITETPYIIRKHDEFSPAILKRKSIRTLSNCQACHTTASRGIYSERYIHIPQ